MSTVWQIFSDYLFFIHFAYQARIHSFVLMSNHFHLMASFPEGNLSAAMNYFMRETSRVIAFESDRINHVYGGRVFRSCLSSNLYFEHTYKYIYRNPVEARMCARVEDYPFSTLHGLLGKSRTIIPLQEDTLLLGSSCFEDRLSWLNKAPSPEAKDAVRKALRQPNFKLPKLKSSRKTHPLESEPY